MKLAVGQMDPQIGNPQENLIRVRKVLDEADKSDVDVLVLPELCNSGYVFRTVDEAIASSETIPTGPVCQELREWSKNNRVVVAGINERISDELFNSAAIFKKGSHICTYRKIHLFLNEFDWFKPGGEEPPVFEYGDCKLGVMICFDWIFPEVSRILALKGAQIILHPANLVLPYCQDAMITRSIENRIFTATANRIGIEREVKFSGFSQITDTKGNRLCRMDADSVGISIADIEPELAADKSITKRNDVLGDRRPDLYKRLTRVD